jgi:hypothetical protein
MRAQKVMHMHLIASRSNTIHLGLHNLLQNSEILLRDDPYEDSEYFIK